MIDSSVLQEIASDVAYVAHQYDNALLMETLDVAIDAARQAGAHMMANLGSQVGFRGNAGLIRGVSN